MQLATSGLTYHDILMNLDTLRDQITRQSIEYKNEKNRINDKYVFCIFTSTCLINIYPEVYL